MTTPTTATLTYSVPDNNTTNSLATATNNVVLYTSTTDDPVLQGIFGVTVASDTVDNSVLRTIVLTLSATFFERFPTAAAWVGAFANLYTSTLQQALGTAVTAGAVVFA
jgi:hypothetical protein